MEDNLKNKTKKWKTTSKKNERRPLKKMEDNLKKNDKRMEDNLNKQKTWKTTSKNKMEDEPIHQNQPNWL